MFESKGQETHDRIMEFEFWGLPLQDAIRFWFWGVPEMLWCFGHLHLTLWSVFGCLEWIEMIKNTFWYSSCYVLQVEKWLCDSEVSEVCRVFGQLPYDVYEVLEQFIWFELLSISKPDGNLLWKPNEKNFGDLRGKLVLWSFGVFLNFVSSSIYRPRSQQVRILSFEPCKWVKG